MGESNRTRKWQVAKRDKVKVGKVTMYAGDYIRKVAKSMPPLVNKENGGTVNNLNELKKLYCAKGLQAVIDTYKASLEVMDRDLKEYAEAEETNDRD